MCSFDESVEVLNIEKLVLLNSKREEGRIKLLIKKSVDAKSVLIGFMLYDVQHFFETGYEVNLKTFSTNDFAKLIENCNDLDRNKNLCIFEFKEVNDSSIKQAEQLLMKIGLVAVVVNENLDKQYQLNCLYK